MICFLEQPLRGALASHRQTISRVSCSWKASSQNHKRRLSSSTLSGTAKSADGPLAGIKVLDLSRVLAAPFCTQILGDYGADVIKVEDVDRGDDTRYWRAKGEDSAWESDSGPISYYFAAMNRNKRSICLDLKHKEGRRIFLKLAGNADVIVENMRPGTTAKLGIDYEAVSKANPRLIYASVSGYGSTGPFANRAGYDMMVAAEAGLLHITGEKHGRPVKPGIGLTDVCTGLLTHGAILAALHARDRTGRGQKIDASLFETQVALLINVGMSWLNMGQEAERWGTQHPSIVPYDVFNTKDSYIVCGATNDKQFKELCDRLSLGSLQNDEKFKTNANRVDNRDLLFPILNEAFVRRTTTEWIAAFEGTGLPYASVNNIQKVFEHPQTSARHMIQDIQFDAAQNRSMSLIGPAVKFSDTKPSIRRKPPLLGEHTDEVLSEIGISDQKIAELRASRVI